MICRTTTELINVQPRQAFISYAHVDEPWKERLLKALAPLETEGLVKIWHDGKLLPGDNWHIKTLGAIADSELVLLLVSRALLQSKYVNDTEVPFAIDRQASGKTMVVPMILESCDWTKLPFARYQALPGDRIPIAERADVDDALKDCLERIRLTFVPNREPKFQAETAKDHSLLVLRLDFPGAEGEWPNWSGMIGKLRKTVHGAEVRTNQAKMISAQEDVRFSHRWEWIIEGPSSALAAIEATHRAGTLSAALGINVVSLNRDLGASLFSSTYLVNDGEAPPPLDRMLTTGINGELPRLHGIAVRPSDPSWFMPLFWKVGNEIEGEDWEREKQKLLGYFYTALALPNDTHVNLSAFEKDRVMPRNLAQTPFGQLLVEQDCLLKQLTATMQHPATDAGRAYWERIEALVQRSGKRRSCEMWQKVWIVPGSATLQQKSAGEPFPHPLPPGFEIRKEDWSGWISECSLRVMCEIDYLALQKRAGETNQSVNVADSFLAEAMSIFREEILTGLIREVNSSAAFASLRQAYFGVGLAKWYREHLTEMGIHNALMAVATQFYSELGDSGEIGPGPEAPNWMNACFDRYLGLLDGVFRLTRPEPRVLKGAPRFRVFHSGSISL